MKRYRRRGGFTRLMSISCALTAVRLMLLVLSAVLFLARKAYAAALVLLAFSLLVGLGAFLLIHRCGMASTGVCALEAAANACTSLAVLLCLALHLRWMQIPAGILSFLSLLGLTRKLRRLKQPAV